MALRERLKSVISHPMNNLNRPILNTDKIWGTVNIQNHYPFTETLNNNDNFIDALKEYVTINSQPGVRVGNNIILRDSKYLKGS
jgi:hypothetical protein